MKPFKCFVSQTTTHRKEYKLATNGSFDPYWDDYYKYYRPKGRRKYKARELLHFQVRMYRSWKHNRKTQWK